MLLNQFYTQKFWTNLSHSVEILKLFYRVLCVSSCVRAVH